MAVSVEEVASSLVREYLSRKGLRRTIACMDEELPRTDRSINNRSQLRQILNMENLYRQNKIQDSPLKTLLEILVKHHTEDFQSDKITSKDRDCIHSYETVNTTASSAVRSTLVNDTETEDTTMAYVNYKHSKLRYDKEEACSPQPTHTSLLPETDKLSSQNQAGCYEGHKGQAQMSFLQYSERKSQNKESTQRSKANQIRRGMMSGPIANTPQEPNKKRLSRRLEEAQKLLRKEETTQSWDSPVVAGFQQRSLTSSLNEISSDEGTWSGPERIQAENNFEKLCERTATVKTWRHVAEVDMSEMVLDDIDDGDQLDPHTASFDRTIADSRYAGRPMDQHTAVELKALLLGSSLTFFSAEWRSQGFTFSETHDLRYGIVQKKGGPCGVLASIQAFVLKKLLFENFDCSSTGLQRLSPSNTTRRKCLGLAAAEILWRAGEEKQATIAINSGRNHFSPAGHYKSEGLLEKITCFTVESIKDLQLLLEQHIEQFETGAFGCLLLTISAVLSRSIKKVREDMDVPTTSLIGAHGYCTQELVNLLLCGKAVSNVFDNDMELDSGNGNMTLLKGIKGHCDIGLLSLFEHYNICKVGDYLKTPRFPIWVVCSESHFSVLFGLQRELLTSEDKDLEFDLYYYDGLANQQEEIRLTVSVGKSTTNCDDSDLVPPLEHCIRTSFQAVPPPADNLEECSVIRGLKGSDMQLETKQSCGGKTHWLTGMTQSPFSNRC